MPLGCRRISVLLGLLSDLLVADDPVLGFALGEQLGEHGEALILDAALGHGFTDPLAHRTGTTPVDRLVRSFEISPVHRDRYLCFCICFTYSRVDICILLAGTISGPFRAAGFRGGEGTRGWLNAVSLQPASCVVIPFE